MRPVDLIIDGLAAWRITHLVIEDHFPPVETAREAILRRVPEDGSISYLMSCPYCVGVWAGIGVTLGRRFFPKTAPPILAALAVAAIVPFVEHLDYKMAGD